MQVPYSIVSNTFITLEVRGALQNAETLMKQK